eukprot:scaffold75443_cov72-Attheya_sp.AAC.1
MNNTLVACRKLRATGKQPHDYLKGQIRNPDGTNKPTYVSSLCNDVRRCVALCDSMRLYATLCDSMQLYATLCNSMRRCALLCDAVRRYAPLCDAVPHEKRKKIVQRFIVIGCMMGSGGMAHFL